MFGSTTASSRFPSRNFPAFYLPSLDSDSSASRTPRAPATVMPKPGRNLPQPPVNVDAKQFIDYRKAKSFRCNTYKKQGRGYSCGSSAAAKKPPAFDPLRQHAATPATPIPPVVYAQLSSYPGWGGAYLPSNRPTFAFPFSNFALFPTLRVQSPHSTQGYR
jgi:hypothetical protein